MIMSDIFTDELIKEMDNALAKVSTGNMAEELKVDYSQFETIKTASDEHLETSKFPIVSGAFVSTAADTDKSLLNEKLHAIELPDIIEEAHPESSIMADGPKNSGLVENLNEQREKILNVINKMPTGFVFHSFASAISQLVKYANALEDKGDIKGVKEVDDVIKFFFLKSAEVPDPVDELLNPKKTPAPVSMSPNKVQMSPGPVSMKPGPVSMVPNKVEMAPKKVQMTPNKVQMSPGQVSTKPGPVDLPPLPVSKKQVQDSVKKSPSGTVTKWRSGFGHDKPKAVDIPHQERMISPEEKAKLDTAIKNKKMPLTEKVKNKVMDLSKKYPDPVNVSEQNVVKPADKYVQKARNSKGIMSKIPQAVKKLKGKPGKAALGLAAIVGIFSAVAAAWKSSSNEWKENLDIVKDEARKSGNQNAALLANKIEQVGNALENIESAKERELSPQEEYAFTNLQGLTEKLVSVSDTNNMKNAATTLHNIVGAIDATISNAIGKNRPTDPNEETRRIMGMQQWFKRNGVPNMQVTGQITEELRQYVRQLVENMHRRFGGRFALYTQDYLNEKNLLQHGDYETLNKLLDISQYPHSYLDN